ncbi:MAG: hypothetical protein ACJ746_02785 [Bryobacteraceae bacterium]
MYPRTSGRIALSHLEATKHTYKALRYPRSDHYDGKRFFNPAAPPTKGLLDVLRWKMTSRTAPWAPRPESASPANPPPPSVEDARCRITFINHATVLI